MARSHAGPLRPTIHRPAAVIVLASLVTVASLIASPGAQEPTRGTRPPGASPITEQLPTLKEELRYGLRARLPRELAFLDRVVALVENGQLPRSLVRGTFAWARQRNIYRPFPYFEFGLRALAKRLGVSI